MTLLSRDTGYWIRRHRAGFRMGNEAGRSWRPLAAQAANNSPRIQADAEASLPLIMRS